MRYLLVIVLIVFSRAISVAQISVFPHNENFETFSTCFESCTNPCTLSSGWTNPTTDVTDWIVDINGTLTPGTGPSANGGADHNPGIAGGKYLYLESSTCNSVSGYLETPLLDFTSGTYPYFTFWYHMYGGSMGTLHVDISTDGGTTYTNDIVPSITANINAWQQATVALGAYGGQVVKIRFRGITGIGGSSDMAIDDVTFYLLDQMDVSVTNIQSNDSLFCDYATNELCIEITNNDTIQLDSGVLNVRINGALFNSPFPFTVSSLAPGASTTVCLGQAPLTAGDVVSAVISLPNGVGDPVSANDSLAETIVLQALPTINLTPDTLICPNDTITLGGSPTGPTGATYAWANSGGYLSSSTAANPLASTSSVETYYVTVTDTIGCVNSDSVQISNHSLPIVDAGSDVALCPSASYNFGGSPTSPTGVNFSWYGPNNNLLSTLSNPTLVIANLGQYIVFVEDANACVNSDTMFVTAPANVVPNAGNDVTICQNDSIQMGDVSSSAYTYYAWSPGALLNDSTISNPIAFASTATQYVLEVQDTFGCVLYDTINVGVFALPLVDAGANTTICSLDSVQLGGAPTSATAITFNWSPGVLFNDSSIANPMAFVPADTVFYVSVTDANGCSAMDSIIVATDSIPYIDAGLDMSLCYGDVTLIGGFPAGLAGSTFHWSPGSLLNDSTIANPQYTVLANQTFILEVTDTNGCHGFDTVSVSVNTASSLPQTPDTTVCLNDTFSLLSTPSAAFNAYSWSASTYITNVNANPIQTFVTGTTQYIVAAADTFGCGYVDTIMVYAYAAPVANAGPDVVSCFGDSVQIGGTPSGNLGSTYTWSAGGLLNNSTLANPTALASVDTVFVLTVVDSNSCVAHDTMTFTTNALPFADAGADISGCIGTTINIGGAPSGDVSSTFSWSPTTGLSNASLANPTYTIVDTVQFFLTVTDTNGCISVDSIFVDNLPLPDIDAGSDVSMCIGDSIQIGGSPTSTSAISYAWSPNNGTLSDTSIANPFSNSLVNATYVLTVTDNQGCVNMDTVSVTINPLPTINITASNTPCHGDTIQITATGGSIYQWANDTYFNSLTAADPMVLINDTITLNVQVTDTNGCVNVDSITINPYAIPQVDAGPDLSVCVGQSVQIQGVTATNFSWSPDSSLVNFNTLTPVSTPNVNTDYILTSTTGGGQCVAYDTITVTLTPLSIFTLVDSVENCNFSFGDVAPISSENLTYSWSTNTASIALQNAMDSALSFSASDSGYIFIQALNPTTGCISYDSVFVVWHPKPVATASPTPVINCIGDSIQLEAFGGDIYQWYPSNGLSSASISNPILVVYADTTLNAIVTSIAGCSDTVAVPIAAADLVVANAGPDVEICQLDTIQLGATGGLTYQWVFDASLSADDIANPYAYPAFTKTYTVVAYNQYGCHDDDQVTVIVNALPNVSAGVPKSVCNGQSVQIGGNPTGPSNSTYTWSPSTTVDDAASSNPFVSPTVDTRYYVTVTTNKGCQDSSNVMVTVNALPTLNLVSGPETICRNDSTSIAVTPGIKKYRWSPSTYMLDSTKASVTVYPKQSTIYTVTATDNNGCYSTLEVSVEVNQLPSIKSMDAKEICFGDSVEIEGYSATAVSYRWIPGSVVSDSNANITYAKPGAMTNLVLQVTDQYGCENKANQRVIVHALPFADAGDDISNCEMDAVYIGGNPTANAGDIVTWTPAEYLDNPYALNPLALTPERTVFVLTVQNDEGCYSIDSVEVNADCYALIYAPNAFTPGNNGINDLFKITYYRIKEPKLTIYNRLGQVVYETTNLDKGWDGVSSTMGSECEAGVYYWTLVYKSEDSKKLVKDGTVTILR